MRTAPLKLCSNNQSPQALAWSPSSNEDGSIEAVFFFRNLQLDALSPSSNEDGSIEAGWRDVFIRAGCRVSVLK